MIHSDPISIPLTDKFELSSSNDSNSLTYTATARYSGNGNLIMNIQMNSSGTDNTFQYQQFGRGIDRMVDYFPDSTGNAPQQFDNMQIGFDMSGFIGSSQTGNSVDTSFYPPDLEFKVVERAKVIVKYVGGPIYVPPSADPEYDASKAVGISYFPASANPEYETSAAAGVTYFPESSDPNYDEEMAQIFESKSRLDLRA